MFFEDYDEARTYAQESADRLKMDVGLEKWREYLRKGYRVFLLPRPKNRCGYELRCEVVSPNQVPSPRADK